MGKTFRWASLVTTFAATAACDQGAGYLRGASLVVPDCQRMGENTQFAPFELSLDFLGLNEAGGSVVMRMSDESGRASESDQLVIAFSLPSDELRLASAEAERVVTLTPAAEGDAEATLALFGRCAQQSATMTARGTLTLTHWGTRSGSRVSGRMAFDLLDRRSGDVLGEQLAGEFDFTVKTGSPWSPFAPHDP